VNDIEWKIALADVTVGDEERLAVDEVLRSGWLSMGPKTGEFEQALGLELGTNNVLAVTNGTAALHLAAVALDIGPGDEVIVPALKFVASAAAFRQTGASVRLADSTSLDDFALDPQEIERLVTQRTRAVVAVHYAGFPCDMDVIAAISAKHNLVVVEDAAHAIGASLNGKSCGTLGAAGCFSFFPNKNMTTAEGGAVAFEDSRSFERARSLRSHSMTTLTWDRHRGHASSYDVLEVGFNYRIDEMRSALGVVQLGRLHASNARRGELMERYRARLDGCRRLSLPTQGARGCSAFHIAVVVTESEELRAQLRESLRAERIQTSVHYPAIAGFSAYLGEETQTPRAEAIAARSLTLPLHPNMTDADVDLVCEVVRAACGDE
jgi:dTDP-4-amino-4,6-dideoxygalactose transaminase